MDTAENPAVGGTAKSKIIIAEMDMRNNIHIDPYPGTARAVPKHPIIATETDINSFQQSYLSFSWSLLLATLASVQRKICFIACHRESPPLVLLLIKLSSACGSSALKLAARSLRSDDGRVSI